jgi:hypothetical protein
LVFSAYLLLARAAIVPAQQPADTPSNTSDQKPREYGPMTILRRAAPVPLPRQKRQICLGVPPIMQTRNLPANCVANWKNCRRSGRTRQLHKRCNTAPIPEQIARLEEKRKHLQDQIEAIYEEARRKDILPGACDNTDL